MVVTVVFLNGGNHTILVNKVSGIALSKHRVYQLVMAWMRTDDDVQRSSDDPVAEVVGYNDLGDRYDFLTMLANSADSCSETEYDDIAKEVNAFETKDLAEPKNSDDLTQSDTAYIAWIQAELDYMKTGIDRG